MFLGTQKIKLDERKRIAVPTRFRDFIKEASKKNPIILTGNPHGCLVCYVHERFEAIKQKIRSVGNTNQFDNHLEEVVLGMAEPLEIDSAGRIQLAPVLCEYAKIEKSVYFIGVGDSVKIWDEVQWLQVDMHVKNRIEEQDFSENWKSVRL